MPPTTEVRPEVAAAAVGTYRLPKDFAAYDAGTVLQDVPYREALALECNRCGDCCDSSRPAVKTDARWGMPLWVWGSKLPADRYAGRFGGEAMVIPLVRGDGGMVPGDDFERDADGVPYRAFRCRFLEGDGDATRCGIYENSEAEGRRPYNCGAFPVFGQEVADSVIHHGTFVPPTGALPRCTWYGIRIVGPYKDSPGWRQRWADQQAGRPVPDLSLPQEWIDSVVGNRRS